MKSKILLVVFGVLILCAYSCSSKGDGSVSEVIVNGNTMYVMSLNNLKSDIVTIPLSSLVENCELVQLESVDDAYVGLGITTITERYIGVRQSRTPYKLFDRSGKYLRNIGSIGGGPGEWTASLYDEIIDEKNEMIYLAPLNRSDKILVYSTSGQYQKDIVAPHRLQKPIMFLSNNTLTVVHMPFVNDKAIAYQFDVNTGEVLKELGPPPAHLIVEDFNDELFSLRNESGVFDLVYTNSDTLYHFDLKDNKLLPFFNVTYETSQNIWKRYFQITPNLFLTNLRLFKETTPPSVEDIGIVATDLTSKTSSRIKVVNDYYGNIPISFAWQIHNGYWVMNLQPEQLMEIIEKRLAESSCTENDRQVLNKTLSTLKENTNNVVFIGKLKSEVEMNLF